VWLKPFRSESVHGPGNLVNDAHLAALALEQPAGIVSYDSDFGRFDAVSWATPDELPA